MTTFKLSLTQIKGFAPLETPLASRFYDPVKGESYDLRPDQYSEIKDRQSSPYAVTILNKLPCWYLRNSDGGPSYCKEIDENHRSSLSPTSVPITTSPIDPATNTPYSLNMRIKYQPSDLYTWGSNVFLERKCIGTLIANNVIITSSACCENIQDFTIINSAGGTNGMVNGSGKYLMQGVDTGHGSAALLGASYLCKRGQRKNGSCKKYGKRRKREAGDDDLSLVCILQTPFNIMEEFKMETIKDCLTFELIFFKFLQNKRRKNLVQIMNFNKTQN